MHQGVWGVIGGCIRGVWEGVCIRGICGPSHSCVFPDDGVGSEGVLRVNSQMIKSHPDYKTQETTPTPTPPTLTPIHPYTYTYTYIYTYTYTYTPTPTPHIDESSKPRAAERKSACKQELAR